MKKFYLLALMVLGLMTACQKEDFVSVNSDPGFEVTASLEEMIQTRTQMVPGENGGYKNVWSANDAISVFNDGAHWRFYVKAENAGTNNAKLSYDPSFDASVSGGIENEVSAGVFVAVYPFNEDIVLEKNGNDFVINTEIPAEQAFVAGSYGQNASLMVAVNTLKPSYAFKNVGSVLCMPLKGEATIISATLESASHKIAGEAVVTAVAEKNFEPIVTVDNGVSKIALTFAEGVELSKTEATNFCFVLAPGTYEANDLKVTFYDNKGNYFESYITATNEFVRSDVRKFSDRTFVVSGKEDLKQKVVAKAGATMEAERIVPALPSLDYIRTWAEALMTDEDASSKIKQAATYISLKNFRAAYDLLGGIPGFEYQTTAVRAYGLGEAEIGSLGVFASLLGGIENVTSIETLIPFLKELEKAYETSNIGGEIDDMFFGMLDNSSELIDKLIDAFTKADADAETSVEEILAEYKSDVKTSLGLSLLAAKGAALVASGDNKTKIQEFVDAATPLYDNIDSYTSKEAIEKEINKIKPVSIKFKIFTKEYEVSFDPADFLTFSANYEEKLGDLLENSMDIIKPLYQTAIDNLKSKGLVEILEETLANPDSYSSKIVTALFAQESFMNMFKSSLVTIVEKVEETIKNNTDANNELILQTAVENAIHAARLNALTQLETELDKTNANEINKLFDGAWGILLKAFDQENPNVTVIDVFNKLGIQDVYTAIAELVTIAKDVVTYNEGPVTYDKENYADYIENEDWWLVTINE